MFQDDLFSWESQLALSCAIKIGFVIKLYAKYCAQEECCKAIKCWNYLVAYQVEISGRILRKFMLTRSKNYHSATYKKFLFAGAYIQKFFCKSLWRDYFINYQACLKD